MTEAPQPVSAPVPPQGDAPLSRVIALNLVVIGALFFVNKFGLPGNIAFFGAAALLVVRGYVGVAQAVSLLALVIAGNTAFVTRSSSVFGVMKFGLLIVAAACLTTELRRAGAQFYRQASFIALWAFIGVAAILAMIIDNYLLVSIMKLVALGVGFTVIFGLSEMARRRGDNLSAWFVSLIAFVAAAGVAAWVMGFGFNAKTYQQFALGLFNGPLYHPQTLGPACALMIVYLVCLGLYTPFRRPWLSGVLIVCLAVFLFFSSSRTGTLAVLVGLTVAIGYRLASLRGQSLVDRVRRTGNRVEILVVLCCLGVIVADTATQGRMRERVAAFATKTLHTSSYTVYRDHAFERMLFSRKGQISTMVENISQHPWTGIGFGISTSDQFGSKVTLFSAPTEKGFLPLAVVEETGVVGSLFFLVFIVVIYRYLLQQKNGPGIAMLSTLLGANMGEMMFFSFGGRGLLMWIFVGGGMALGAGGAGIQSLRNDPT